MTFQNYDFHSFEFSIHGRLEGIKILCLFNHGIDMTVNPFRATTIDIIEI